MNIGRPHNGKLQAVILDWAGTIVDHGSLAPVRVLQELFESHDVPITQGEARLDMGLLKKDHIRAILSGPRVISAWTERHAKPPSEADVEKLFADFIPRQLDCLANYSELLPGVLPTVRAIRDRGLKVATTTGYTRPMLDLLLAKAADQGFVPDSALCPEDVGGGRPYPWMCYENAVRLQLYPLESFVKIGDTLSDIEEGLNAGMWSVGVSRTGNLVGLSEADFSALPREEQNARTQTAATKLTAAGAHYVIESISDVLPVLDAIDNRLFDGERP